MPSDSGLSGCRAADRLRVMPWCFCEVPCGGNGGHVRCGMPYHARDIFPAMTTPIEALLVAFEIHAPERFKAD